MLRIVKLLDEVKKLIIESDDGEISYNGINKYYPKYFADVDTFIVIDDVNNVKQHSLRYVIAEPHQARGLYIYRQHTTDFHNRFQFTIDDKVFE